MDCRIVCVCRGCIAKHSTVRRTVNYQYKFRSVTYYQQKFRSVVYNYQYKFCSVTYYQQKFRSVVYNYQYKFRSVAYIRGLSHYMCVSQLHGETLISSEDYYHHRFRSVMYYQHKLLLWCRSVACRHIVCLCWESSGHCCQSPR